MKTLRAQDFERTTKLDDRRQAADNVAGFPNLIVASMLGVLALLIMANLMFHLPEAALTVLQSNVFVGP
jgi:hypothetical protein